MKKKNALARHLNFIAALFLLAACSNPLGIDALHQAAGQGDVQAQMKLADRYFIGDGVPHDKAQSAFWFRKAAAQGQQYGFYRLGQAYEFGHGVVPDIHLAAENYRQSALKDAAHVQDAMARLHASGALGQKDYAESHKWQVLSARHNGLMWQATDYGAAQFLSSAEKQAALRAAAALEKSFK